MRPNQGNRTPVNSTFKTAVFWIVMLCTAILLWKVVNANAGEKVENFPFTRFMNEIEQGSVQEVTITGQQVEGRTAGGKFRSVIPKDYPKIYDELTAQNVKVDLEDPASLNFWTVIWQVSPFILIIAFWIFMMRQMQAGGNKALSFGKSRARLLTNQQKKVTFKDVAGVEEAKEELQEIIEFLREPQKFQKLGGRIPKGVLLIGPPGTGKTLLARAVAGEANVPFFSISGSDFVEMFVGVGASRVRDLFEQGKKSAPCIIFIDEIDAVGRHRGAGLGGGHDEREQTLNQLLVEMDGFDSNEGVILTAATNRPDVLDPALLRPGRFDRRVVVSRPDVRGRQGILQVHTQKIPLSDDVDLSVLARGTPGFSGADLANLTNESALFAARQNRKVVTMADFELAKDKVMMGAERRSMILTDEEKKNTAYHEAGHAVVAALLEQADPLHKVTIIPRGQALGVTMQLPVDDKHTYTQAYLRDQLAILMGGRIAEEMFMEHMTTGAGNDIERATAMARQMVCEWGMSNMGPLTFGKHDEQVFLGREIGRQRDYSEATAIRIDAEVRALVSESYDRAKQLIDDNSDGLVRIAEALLEREVLDGEEVAALLEGRSLAPLDTRPPALDDEGTPEEESTGAAEPEPRASLPGLEGGEPSPA